MGLTETVATADIPGRGTERLHPSTLLRLILKGCRAPGGRRVRLEGVRIGYRWTVTREALDAFFAAMTPTFDDEETLADAIACPSDERGDSPVARKLAAAGI